MKNRTLNIALFSLLIAITSCNKISEEIQQDIVINDTVYFEVPILSTDNSSAVIPSIPLSFDLEEQVKNSVNSFTLDQVKGTKIKDLNLALGVDKEGAVDTINNFSNLASVKFKITAPGSFGNLANSATPMGGTIGTATLTPVIIPDSLKTFLLNPARTYEVTVKARKATTTPMAVRAAATYIITLAK